MIIEVTGTLVVQKRVQEWCALPYPDHPKGCPNIGHTTLRTGKKEPCPPHAPMIREVFDLTKPHWFFVERFDLGAHVNRMREKHPDRTIRQARCVLCWQNKPRAALKRQCEEFVRWVPYVTYTLCPEAMGVNVFRTCHRHRLMMRRNPRDTVYLVAFVGYES